MLGAGLPAETSKDPSPGVASPWGPVPENLVGLASTLTGFPEDILPPGTLAGDQDSEFWGSR